MNPLLSVIFILGFLEALATYAKWLFSGLFICLKPKLNHILFSYIILSFQTQPGKKKHYNNISNCATHSWPILWKFIILDFNFAVNINKIIVVGDFNMYGDIEILGLYLSYCCTCSQVLVRLQITFQLHKTRGASCTCPVRC